MNYWLDKCSGDLNNMNTKNETVTISKEEYERLLNDSYFLNRLKICGVDNWTGYGDAQKIMKEEEECC